MDLRFRAEDEVVEAGHKFKKEPSLMSCSRFRLFSLKENAAVCMPGVGSLLFLGMLRVGG